MTALLDAPAVQASTPVPSGRGQWRVTLHTRSYTSEAPNGGWLGNIISELPDARGRTLTQQLNQPATFTFTLNGRSSEAALIRELEHDVRVWRWDDSRGRDMPVFRGVIGQAEDQLTEQAHTVVFTCHDYGAMLDRRYLTAPIVFGAPAASVDQDDIVLNLLNAASAIAPSAGGSFSPGSFLPLGRLLVNPDGSGRVSRSGQLRDRTYAAQSSVGQSLSDLGAVIGGFDFDVVPDGYLYANHPATGGDSFRVFYPQQGVTLTDPVLEYGGAVATVTRTVDSGNYANYVRVVGNNGSSDPTAPQLYGEAWNTDANNVGVVPIGLWQNIDSASDVTVQSTLTQKAQGDLDMSGVLIPSYTLGLRPGAYHEGLFHMGDTVPIVIRSGRLNVTTSVRIVGITFRLGDDGQEDVELTVGRPLTSLLDMLAGTAADVDALARR